MKKRFFIFWILFNAIAFHAKSQAPDLSKLNNANDKIKAWIDYCKVLRLNKDGAANNYILLQKAGLQGLQLVQPNDHLDKASFYLYTALGYYYQIKFDSAQYYFYQSQHSAQLAGSTKLIAASSEALMSLNFQLQQSDKVDECKTLLQTIADTTKDKSILQDIYSAFGSFYQQKSYYSAAQDYYIKSIQLREKYVDTTEDSKAKFDYAIQCDQLSKLYLNTQMADKSLAALRKGQRFANVSPLVHNRLLSSFVEAFTTSGNIDSALYYNNQLAENTQNQTSFSSELVSSNLNIAIYYIDHKEYGKALPYAEKGDSLATVTQSPFLIFQSQMIMGRYLQETGNYEKSISLLNGALPIAQQLNKELYSNILKYLALDYKGLNNSATSLQYYERYVGLQDTLSKEKLSRTFADLETHYQTNEKEQRIVSLNQKNKLNILELKQASNTKHILILGLISLSIFSLLLYFIYRNREKLNKQLNHQKAELQILNGQLSVANDTKAKLFGIVSHDLRAPVSKIIQLMQLQKEHPHLLDEPTARKHEAGIKQATEMVLETMEDLLLWSKSQMQQFKADKTLVNIQEVVSRECDFLQSATEEKNIAISNSLPQRFLQTTDENFIAVIIRNLLQNAIKYSDANTAISITAEGNSLQITNTTSSANVDELNHQFSQKQISSKASGLGLQIVSDLAAQLNLEVFFKQEASARIVAIIRFAQ
ncbi:MAG: HAMP domain-containing histidine kinase [Bacteroidota bacterium]|nr:HAMP domain-containing histidine kinase [Bacteroidota bacterium]